VTRFIHIRNFTLFTHYKKRPLRWNIWVKAHVSELKDQEFIALSLAQRGLLYQLRLLYAENCERGVTETKAKFLLALSAGDQRRFRAHLEVLNDAGYVVITDSEELHEERPSAS
jgi:hypothetical protein